jgi:predicted dehydrogenase
MKMVGLTRRRFMKTPVLSATGVILSSRFWAGAHGANDDVRVAIVGLRKRGKEHIECFRRMKGARITALCDADTDFLDFQTGQFKSRNERVSSYIDYRGLLNDKNIDAVIVVSPDHWHGLMTVWACQAGKDVYVEKPLSHTIWEGRQMVKATRKYDRIVQVGSQNRSDVGLRRAIPWIQAGNLGPVLQARGFHNGQRQSIGTVNGPQPTPPTCDYNLFQGPAPLRPLRRAELHYDWHWFWDTGTGEMGNIGAHQLDHARWAIGQKTVSTGVISLGGRFGYDDDGETPNTQVAFFDYGPVPLSYEICGVPRVESAKALDAYRGVRASMVLECEGGFFAGGRGGGWAYDNAGRKIRQFEGDGGQDHQANFIRAVRSRRRNDLRADILEGHISATLCHMANISYRLGREVRSRSVEKACGDRPMLAESVNRMLRRLSANGVDTDSQQVVLGPALSFDIEKEEFVGEYSDWANMLLKGDYRPPFLMPQL